MEHKDPETPVSGLELLQDLLANCTASGWAVKAGRVRAEDEERVLLEAAAILDGLKMNKAVRWSISIRGDGELVRLVRKKAPARVTLHEDGLEVGIFTSVQEMLDAVRKASAGGGR